MEEPDYEELQRRFNELLQKVRAGTQDSDKQDEFDDILESTVERNDGEVADFIDDGKVIRQRPHSSTAVGVNYQKVLPWDAFKYVFEVGLTKTEVNRRLGNPDTSDGQPIGTNLTHPKIGVGNKGFDRKQ